MRPDPTPRLPAKPSGYKRSNPHLNTIKHLLLSSSPLTIGFAAFTPTLQCHRTSSIQTGIPSSFVKCPLPDASRSTQAQLAFRDISSSGRALVTLHMLPAALAFRPMRTQLPSAPLQIHPSNYLHHPTKYLSTSICNPVSLVHMSSDPDIMAVSRLPHIQLSPAYYL